MLVGNEPLVLLVRPVLQRLWQKRHRNSCVSLKVSSSLAVTVQTTQEIGNFRGKSLLD